MKQNKFSGLKVLNLCISIAGREILRGVNLDVEKGRLHVVMGPNGSGKSTLTYAVAGHPDYPVIDKNSEIILDGKSIKSLSPDERAKKGLMLAFQNPLSIPGVTLSSFLRTAYYALYGQKIISVLEFHRLLVEKAKLLSLPPEFLRRAVNDGLSGGEKKKAEMLQLLVLRPKFAIFDEIDTGLDVDALTAVSRGIGQLILEGTGILLITHYQRILNYLKPDQVHILKNGQIVKSGGAKLASVIEAKGYANL